MAWLVGRSVLGAASFLVFEGLQWLFYFLFSGRYKSS